MGGSKGGAHLESVAIFTAFITVTTLFSFMSLGMGTIWDDRPVVDPSTYPILTANEPDLARDGEIVASPSVQDPTGTYVDLLAIRIAHTGERNVINLSLTTVTVMSGDYLKILSWSEETVPGPGMWTAAPSSDRGSVLLKPKDKCTVIIHLDRLIHIDDNITIMVRQPGSRPCIVTGRIKIPCCRC